MGVGRHGDVVKAHHRHLLGYVKPRLLQGFHGAYGDQITGTEDGIKIQTALEQAEGGFVALLWEGFGGNL